MITVVYTVIKQSSHSLFINFLRTFRRILEISLPTSRRFCRFQGNSASVDVFLGK